VTTAQPTPPTPADVVLTFLESVGRRSEAELYLRLFRGLPKQSFAILAPGAQVVRSALGSLVEQVKFLVDLDLFAPIVLGLFDPGVATQNAERVVRKLAQVGVNVTLHSMDEEELGAALTRELKEERVPVVHFKPLEGESVEDRRRRVGELARELDTRKILLLRRRGGLAIRGDRPGYQLPTLGRWLSLINLRTDRAALVASKKLPKRDLELLECAERLIEQVAPTPLLVSVASPLNFLKELFTVKGAGTLIKSGTLVSRHDSYAELDTDRLRVLIEASFGRPLATDFFDTPPLAVYLDSQYRGAAILNAAEPAPYLSKFVVEPDAQGEGIGNDLWQAMSRDFPKFFWRARRDNPIISWYYSVSDGMTKSGAWCVLWRGIEASRIPEVVDDALARASDFIEVPPGK
jgi:hypothetical protein